jgi:hypothetical protein
LSFFFQQAEQEFHNARTAVFEDQRTSSFQERLVGEQA